MKTKLLLLTFIGAVFLMTSSFSQNPPVIMDGLVGYWPGEGNANDASGKDNHGTYHGGNEMYAAGQIGNAFLFNGTEYSGQWVETPLKPTPDGMTFSLWVNPNLWASNHYRQRTLFGQDGGTQLAIIGSNQPNLIESMMPGSSGHLWSTNPAPAGQWTHVVFAWNPADKERSIYINGELNVSGPAPEFLWGSNNKNFTFGGFSNAFYFNGLLDEVMLFDRELGSEEVMALFTGETEPDPPYTLDMYEVSEGSHLGFDILDIADVNNDGIMEFTLDVQGRLEIRNFNCSGTIGWGQQWRGWGLTGEFIHIDNDGYIDLAISNNYGNNIVFIKNNQSGGFSGSSQVYSSTNPFRLASGDYDNDGDEDLLVGGWHQNAYILRNDNGIFVLAATLPGTNHRAYALEWVDLDGDLDLDIIIGGQITNPTGDIPIVWRNNGNDQFEAKWFGTYEMYQYMQYVRVGDVDGDGDIDFMLCTYDSNWNKFARIIKNNGNFNFVHADDVPGIFNHLADWGDFNGDGDLEILYLEPFDQNGSPYPYGGHPAIYDYSEDGFIKVWGNEEAVFQNITAADFDGDGLCDFHGHKNPGKIFLSGHGLDDCGECTTCNNPPIALCKDITVYADQSCSAEASIDNGSNDPDGDPITIIYDPPGPYPLGTTVVTMTVSDGEESSTCQATVTVIDNTAPLPTVAELADATGECSITLTAPTADDNCAGALTGTTTDPLYYSAQGTYLVTWTYDDGNGNTVTQTQNVIVDDITPPELDVANSTKTLWPPNHKYKTISIDDFGVSAFDNCGIGPDGVIISTVSSDEPEDAKGGGDGKTKNDIIIGDDCTSVYLRAERQGKGNGRVYTITLSVADEGGNTTTAQVYVHVPHDKKGTALDDGSGSGYTVDGLCGGVIGIQRDIINNFDNILSDDNLQIKNYPNPFNVETTIEYSVSEDCRVVLEVYNLEGKKVNMLLNEIRPAGVHTMKWKGEDNAGNLLPGGIYFARIFSGTESHSIKIILSR